MAEKCVICGSKVEVTFLKKIKGTYVKGKPVCDKCQSKYMMDLIKHIPVDKRKKAL